MLPVDYYISPLCSTCKARVGKYRKVRVLLFENLAIESGGMSQSTDRRMGLCFLYE